MPAQAPETTVELAITRPPSRGSPLRASVNRLQGGLLPGTAALQIS